MEVMKIMLVDDEARFLSTTQKLLTKKGIDAVTAAGGAEALEMLQHKHIHVVILDVKMPGMDGHATLREIKNRKPDLPVIMLTGHAALPSAREAHEKGAYDYLTKPCDIDTLAAKIIEASKFEKSEEVRAEKTLREVMIPIGEYTTLSQESTVKEAIDKLRESFYAKVSTSRIMETGHRSILVVDDRGTNIGILAIIDLLGAVMPAYLSAPKPSTADNIQYSPMFWDGMFQREVLRLAGKKIKDVMSPAPRTIDADANLMEAAYTMITQNKRRLTILDSGKVIGIIREQDLFFEIERILREV